MAFSVRARISVVVGALIVVVLGVFAILVRAVYLEETRRNAEDSVRAFAVEVGTRIVTAGRIEGAPLTFVDNSVTPPAMRPTQRLLDLLEGVPEYVYVFDSAGRTVIVSFDVRALPPERRATLDSVVYAAPTGPRVAAIFQDGRWRVSVSDPFFNRVQALPLRTGTLLVYGIAVEVPPGVGRIVVARVLPPSPFQVGDLVGPLLIVAPLVVLAAAIAAHFALGAAQKPIEQIINDVEAITDGRSLHRRLAMDDAAGAQLTRLTDTLNAMIARLEQSFSGLRRFTADASHELKTPLAVVRADIERAMAAGANSTERLEALEEALAETARMADLVDSLLALARADEGRFDLHREPVDLADLTRDVYETALLLGEARNVHVELQPPEPLRVLGDRDRLRQLWLNLVENAIKYTPPEGRVDLSLTRDNDSARFAVRDTGIGIAAADLAHVFDRFWRADRARSRTGERGGFGLGLAICQYIAQAHGGSVTVQSRLGRGSTFVVTLPMAPPPPERIDT